jgi:hypothetical protein
MFSEKHRLSISEKIADILNMEEANTRKLVTRARKHVV